MQTESGVVVADLGETVTVKGLKRLATTAAMSLGLSAGLVSVAQSPAWAYNYRVCAFNNITSPYEQDYIKCTDGNGNPGAVANVRIQDTANSAGSKNTYSSSYQPVTKAVSQAGGNGLSGFYTTGFVYQYSPGPDDADCASSDNGNAWTCTWINFV